MIEEVLTASSGAANATAHTANTDSPQSSKFRFVLIPVASTTEASASTQIRKRPSFYHGDTSSGSEERGGAKRALLTSGRHNPQLATPSVSGEEDADPEKDSNAPIENAAVRGDTQRHEDSDSNVPPESSEESEEE